MPKTEPQVSELIELLLTEPINDRTISRDNPVKLSNIKPNNNDDGIKEKKEKPKGFAEKFSVFLSETPVIGTTAKSEFFIYNILGSALTLPTSGLIKKLAIEKLY